MTRGKPGEITTLTKTEGRLTTCPLIPIGLARYVIVETTFDAPEDDKYGEFGPVLEVCEIEIYGILFMNFFTINHTSISDFLVYDAPEDDHITGAILELCEIEAMGNQIQV
uniref:Uncharacterized protein n=1 Tax=Magallana gigas TaxID=29159 RepID=K1RFH5_MAGGI